MFGWLKERWRRRIRRGPFPEPWRNVLARNFPLFQQLTAGDQAELEGHIQVFLAEKRFEGCAGLVVTDEMRVTIAAQACLLLLHRHTDYYPELRSIVLYPHPFSVERESYSEHGVVTETRHSNLGESWQHGAVVLAWDSTLEGAAKIADGHNVVMHEFAHQLDQEDGRADGAPVLTTSLLSGRGRYRAWAGVFRDEFERFQREVSQGAQTVMDAYGATDPAEFFAVATECFFEKPHEMRKEHPKLYAQLKGFYRQDPAAWRSPVRIRQQTSTR